MRGRGEALVFFYGILCTCSLCLIYILIVNPAFKDTLLLFTEINLLIIHLSFIIFLFRTSFEAGQHWNLVVLFCRVHKMEFPVTFLQDCARADKWLPFVCHAQACQFPKEQVMHAVLC